MTKRIWPPPEARPPTSRGYGKSRFARTLPVRRGEQPDRFDRLEKAPRTLRAHPPRGRHVSVRSSPSILSEVLRKPFQPFKKPPHILPRGVREVRRQAALEGELPSRLRLDVPMHRAHLMRILQCLADRRHDCQRLLRLYVGSPSWTRLPRSHDVRMTQAPDESVITGDSGNAADRYIYFIKYPETRH